MDYKEPINKENVYTMRTSEDAFEAFNIALMEEQIIQLFPAFRSKQLERATVIDEVILGIVDDFITEIET